MAIARQRLSLEQFLRLPEEKPALDYWHGEVTQKVSPKGPHGAMQDGFGELIRRSVSSSRSFRLFPETRVTFEGVSVVPDLIVYRRERVPRDANGDIVSDFTVPPDVAIEILSPGQSRREHLARYRWYVEHGVALAVFADPGRRVVRVFRPGTDSGELRGTARVDLSDVLPGFSLSVDEIFAPLAADWE